MMRFMWEAQLAEKTGLSDFLFFIFLMILKFLIERLQEQVKTVQNSTGLGISNDGLPVNHIRHTSIPWTSFSALLHPTNFDPKECIPKIAFGKFSVRDVKKCLPVSIEAHHGLADGLHLAPVF